jgi:1-acyl-sn-glycerol-3-phosphate acyltransferase
MITAIYFISYLLLNLLCTYIFKGANYLYYPIFIIINLFIAIIIVLFFVFINFLFCPLYGKKNRFNHYFTRSLSFFVSRFLLQTKVISTSDFKIDKTKTYVFFANHKSLADPLFLLNVLSVPCATTPKKEVYDAPFIGKWLISLGSFEIDRSSDRNTLKSLIQGIELVKSGLNFMIFPEGGIKTRETELMVDIKPGAYKLATKASADVVPVSINGNTKMHKNVPFKSTTVYVHFHKPIEKEEYDKLTTQELGDKVFNLVNQDITKENNNEHS